MYHIVDFDLDESRSVTRRDDQMTITSNQTHPIFKFAFTAERDTLSILPSSTTEPWIKWECKLRCSPDPLDLVPPFDVPESFFQHPMSYHAHPSHRPAKAAKMYPGEFCRHCDPCPTCGARPQPERPASDPVLNEPVRTPPFADGASSERILPSIPLSSLFTLLLLEAHIQGGWRQLFMPYIIILLFYLL
ncbi:hypothetical protein C8F04DRAFT_1174664 [Mycena alexandri]|uniref:Uncharacterized protein n=1 Tax=Mycena alexandri TaxID=1745969 RepID=A0AAD6TEJ4_9AGAR|nr:hypothetical protein C8F04DRAFT_1174664 [Mycena alexandri]